MPGVEVKFTPTAARRADPLAGAVQGVLQEPGGHARGEGRRRAGSTPATRATSTRTGTSRSSTAPRTWASSPTARSSRRSTSRTSSSSSPTSRRRWPSATGATEASRVHQHRHRGGRQLGRAAQHPLLRLHRPRRAQAEVLRAGARVRREGQRRPRARTPSSPTRRSTASSSCTRSSTPTTASSRARARCAAASSREKYASLVDALYGGRRRSARRDAGALRGRAHRHGRAPSCAIARREDLPAAGGEEGGLMSAARGRASIGEVILDRRGHVARLRRREGAAGRQLRRARARDPRHHRPERRRQELDAERDQRRLPPAAGHGHATAARERHDMDPHEAARAGHRAHLPEPRPLQGHVGARQHHDRAQPARCAPNILLQALRIGPALREEIAAPRGGRGDHRLPRDPGLPQDPGRAAALRPAEARRPRARAGDGAEACCCWTSRWPA